MLKPFKPLCLVGFSHCGKSSLASHLAKKHNFISYDSDQWIQDLHPLSWTARRIYKEKGKINFQWWEAVALKNILDKNRKGENQNVIISCGGGVVENNSVLEELKSDCLIIFLSASKKELWERINRRDIPAFLDAKNPYNSFSLLFEKRKPLYEKISHLHIDADKSVEQQAKILFEILKH